MPGDTPSNLPILGVFTENAQDRDYLCKSLQGYFAEFLQIIPLDITSLSRLGSLPKAVVVNITSHKVAQEHFPDSQLVYARRQVNSPQLERLVELPKGEKVLVVNYPQAIAMETRDNLLSLGINHLDLIPYWPGAGFDVSDVEYVIYVGFRSYCPENKKQYIDIGYRSISLTTLGELIKIYDLPTDCLNAHFFDHVTSIVEGLYRTQHMLHKTEVLWRNLEQAHILSSNGLITIDCESKIVVFNPAAEHILGIPAESVLGRKYRQPFRAFNELIQLLDQGTEMVDELIYLQKQPVLATLKVIQLQQERHFFLSLSPVEALQGTVEKARTSMYKKGFTARHTFGSILGQSPLIRETIAVAKCYAKQHAPVLITGESGTGKELFAQAIHNYSLRAGCPFVAANFAAISETLIESELFGYEEGAFTGASKGGKQGLFRQAHKGTIFLDEIGDISPTMQSRLLRVLEEQEIMPVGSTKVIPIDVRLIYATNKNLVQMMHKGTFREDVYYRLKVFTLDIPPLRKRKEDISVMLDAMIGDQEYHKLLSSSLQRKIQDYDWPGNIRELKSLAQYIVMFRDSLKRTPELASSLERLMESFFVRQCATVTVSDEERAILRSVATFNDNNQSAGRYSLLHHPELAPYPLTEAQIKARLKYLEGKGLLISGKTRQGVKITEEGRLYMH